jgi:hypothetical protein
MSLGPYYSTDEYGWLKDGYGDVLNKARQIVSLTCASVSSICTGSERVRLHVGATKFRARKCERHGDGKKARQQSELTVVELKPLVAANRSNPFSTVV